MEIRKAIEKAISIITENTEADLDELAVKISSADIPEQLTDKILEFVPLAFGRVYMRDWGTNFKDEYVRYVLEDGKPVEKQRRKLTNEPVYCEAIKIANKLNSKWKRNKTFELVAFMSSEFLGINELMNKGAKPQDIVLTNPYLPWRDDLSDEDNFTESTDSKNWWQIWK